MAAVIFASFVSVGAVGFDAEKAYDSVFVIYSGDSLGSGFAIGKNCIITPMLSRIKMTLRFRRTTETSKTAL